MSSFFFTLHKVNNTQYSAHPANQPWESSHTGQFRVCIKPVDSHFLHIGNLMVQYLRMKVPTLALAFGMVFENSTVHETETILSLLSQVPLVSREVEDFVEAENCICSLRRNEEICCLVGRVDAEKEDQTQTHTQRIHSHPLTNEHLPGCSKCCVQFLLSVKNEVTSKHIQQVTSQDLVRVPFTNEATLSHASVQVVPTPVPLPLFRLAPGQEFHAVFLGLKGCGLTHTVFSPVGPCSCSYSVKVKVEKESLNTLTSEEKQALADTCVERRLFEYQADQNDFKVRNDLRKCNRCYGCMEFASEKDLPQLICYEDRLDEFVLQIGLVGSLDAPTAIHLATSQMEKNFLDLFDSFGSFL